jgi:hypothetical protein
MTSSFQFIKIMFKFFSFLILFIASNFATQVSTFAMKVSIVATVNDKIITSFDVSERVKASQTLNPEIFKNAAAEEVKMAILERLIQEELLFKMANENGFQVANEDILDSIKSIIATNSKLKNKNLESILGSNGYQSFQNQVKGEIIYNAILNSQTKDKINFSEKEVERFMLSYNSENQKKINISEAKNILTSMKINEIQQNMMKNLQENSIIERKQN